MFLEKHVSNMVIVMLMMEHTCRTVFQAKQAATETVRERLLVNPPQQKPLDEGAGAGLGRGEG